MIFAPSISRQGPEINPSKSARRRNEVNLQIFGTRKCQETRKAERFFRERKIGFQLIDLAEKGISAGELRVVAAAAGLDALIDTDGRRFADKGLAYKVHDAETEILADPLLLRTPVVRDGRRATVGYQADTWLAWIEEERG
jgi:arsenate reductase